MWRVLPIVLLAACDPLGPLGPSDCRASCDAEQRACEDQCELSCASPLADSACGLDCRQTCAAVGAECLATCDEGTAP